MNDSSGYGDSFRDFSGRFISPLDSFIGDFYRNKAAAADEQFMKDMYAAVSEYCLREGKRIRPLLLINSYLGYRKGLRRTGEIIKFAAVIEMMHSLLLIQDDMIDRSILRRGGRALHILMEERYSPVTHNPAIGCDIASVLPDIIFSNALEIISSARVRPGVKNRFLQIFSSTYEKTAWGQILDSLNSMPRRVDVEANYPLKISLMKTAWYTLVYPLKMGYVLSGGNSESEQMKIEEFGVPLGMAFQIRDDLLGAFGAEGETGKPGDSDILEGKLTLLIQNTFSVISGKERDGFMELLLSGNKTAEQVEEIRRKIRETGALEQTLNMHKELVEKSRSALEHMSIGRKNRNILAGVIESIEKMPSLL